MKQTGTRFKTKETRSYHKELWAHRTLTKQCQRPAQSMCYVYALVLLFTCCQPLPKTGCWIRSQSELGWLFSCPNLLQTLHCNLCSSSHWTTPFQWSWSIFTPGLLLKIFCSQKENTLHFEMFSLVTAWQTRCLPCHTLSSKEKKEKKADRILHSLLAEEQRDFEDQSL